MPGKLPKLIELNRLNVVVSETHVDRARKWILRIEIADGRGKRRGMAWNSYSRQPPTGEIIAVEQVHRRTVGHQGPGVDPDGIGKKRRLRRL